MSSEIVRKPSFSEPSSLRKLLLNVKEVAHLLSISPSTVLRRVDDGEIPQPIYLGRLARWRASDIEDCINHKQQT